MSLPDLLAQMHEERAKGCDWLTKAPAAEPTPIEYQEGTVAAESGWGLR